MAAPLAGIRVVTLAPNVPGPVAAARLRALGATVTKIEGPGGDLLASAAPEWYARLHHGIALLAADLKTPEGKEDLEDALATADVLLTSSRPSALKRLGLDWETLHAHHPRLIAIEIVGDPPPEAERPGHDLTYLARAGVLEPGKLPRSLFADLAGAERAVSATLAALLLRERTGEATVTYVSLAEAADALAEPLRAGLTTPNGPLGGTFDGYRMYRSQDGWIALAALEPHFFKDVCNALLPEDGTKLEDVFASRTSRDWEAWARVTGLPLEVVGGS